MGNHEFCEHCHENDFHIGRPCDPERLAKVKADKETRKQRQRDNQQRAIDALRAAGFTDASFSVGEYGHLTVYC